MSAPGVTLRFMSASPRVRRTRKTTKPPKKWKTEAELAAVVVTYLQDLQWEVFQEVEAPGGRPDLVGRQGNRLVTVETKLVLSFDVVAQANHWKRYAHQSFIAVPATKGWSSGRALAYDVCRDRGIGVLVVDRVTTWPSGSRWPNGSEGHVNEEVPAAINRKILSSLGKNLCEEQKTYAAAGSALGGYYTPFKGTCAALLQAVKDWGPTPLRELIERVKHHYASHSSARNHLGHWIEKGKVPGLRIKRDGKKLIVQQTP